MRFRSYWSAKQGNRNEEEGAWEKHTLKARSRKVTYLYLTRKTRGQCREYSINFFIGHISFQIALHHRSHLQSSELFHFRFS